MIIIKLCEYKNTQLKYQKNILIIIFYKKTMKYFILIQIKSKI